MVEHLNIDVTEERDFSRPLYQQAYTALGWDFNSTL